MYKNQLQEFAQRGCINFPSYTCIREGPDHAPRFKARVKCNWEVFESPMFCHTLRQAEQAAAEVAFRMLSSRRGPTSFLAAKVLDETGLYKNLLQETAHRAGLRLPVYTTTARAGPGFGHVFTCTVELVGMFFHGEVAKTKKQAQKSAAMAAWFSLKQAAQKYCFSTSFSGLVRKDEEEQEIVARYLSSIKLPDKRLSLHRSSCSFMSPESPDFISMSPFGSSFGFQPRFSTRPFHQMSCVGQMVPEDQIRSVVPVHSARVRNVPASTGNNDISGASLEFCRLKL